MESSYIVVLITVSNKEEAERLSRILVEEKMAYCVNAIPGVKSFYFWDGNVCVDNEIQLIVKTRAEKFSQLEGWINENHSYDVPEIIALTLADASKAYLKCIDEWVLET